MAIDFAGGTKYLSVSAAPVTATPFTVACWFKAADLTTTSPLFYIGDSASNSEFFALLARGAFGGGTDPVALYVHDNSEGGLVVANTSTSYTVGTWHHAAGIFTSSTSRTAYLDGGGAGTNEDLRIPTGLNLTGIGALLDTSPTQGNSIVAEVGLWNTDLSSTDIAVLAKGVSPLMVRPDALVGYWPLLENSSPSIDLIGGNSMSWTGSPSAASHSRIYYPSAQILQFPPTAAGGGFNPYWAYGSNVLMNNGSP